MTHNDSTVLKIAGVTNGSAVADATATRANIIEMTQSAENAVLRPEDCGAFDHATRAALAARVARLSADEALAQHYLSGAGDHAVLADPSETGASQGLGTVVAFVDKVANQTRDIAPEDIAGLQAEGIADADIVRLCELVAFLAYQIRVIAGLRLMQGELT
ncbi:hypothetical protein [Primorskyibacter flagellatus]|uniref:hypothetical protein n=1 Tax=Primorskyibacter flagellatus TaxID=1387277 RepID=UPI003A8F6A0A